MGAKKVNKDWWRSDGSTESLKTPVKVEYIKSEDLPQLMTIKEVAAFFKCHSKTVEKWIRLGHLQSRKIVGRHFVTPQQIAAFINTQQKLHG